MKLRFIALVGLLFQLACACIQAHEIRPAYLEIRESAAGHVDILWKQPTAGDRSVPIRPRLSSGWLDRDPTTVSATDSALLLEWRIPAPHAPLEGQWIDIDGLDMTMVEVLSTIEYADGSRSSHVISPAQSRYQIEAPGASSIPVWGYLWLGVTHIWGGADHLLYVLGLVLLVAAARPLILTLTSFTLAHSITLALTTLDVVRLPSAPVEAVIALSIVYLAVELMRQARGGQGLAGRRPWLIAFPFGLLHGFGFAGALQEVGLPASDIPAVLLLFNLGIEAGQVAFVVVLFGLAALARKVARSMPPIGYAIQPAIVRLWGAYALGGMASYWLIGRLWLV